MILSVWTLGLLLVTLGGAHGHTNFPANCTFLFDSSHFWLICFILLVLLLCSDQYLLFLYICVVVVAKRNDPHPVTLTCNTQTEEGVSWRLDGEEVELDNYVQMEGPNLKISEVDAPMLGEYSCWRGGTMLSSTYLFQELEEDVELGEIYFLICCKMCFLTF